MNLEDRRRRVPFPKWRALASTPSTELVSASHAAPRQERAFAGADRVRALYERWQETPSIDNALEVLDCSSVISDSGLFSGPAAQIINSDEVTNTSKFVARQVVQRDRGSLSPIFDFGNRDRIRSAIRENRLRLRDEPRNSLLHSEQARLYATIDETDAAKRSFNMALAISPDNRHILRSFARFMVHIGCPDVALQRLRRSSSIYSDPWVQAAEIAISEHHNVGSEVARTATRNLEASRIRPEHVSELAAALATLERSAGNWKKFKKRFLQSLLNPSDNALAQATWFLREFSKDFSDEIHNVILPTVRLSKEARIYEFLRNHKWRDAVRSYADWQNEESFSSHIAIQGSYYALSFAKEYELAISICRNGLIANSTSLSLLNNLCYGERRAGSVNDAVKSMMKLKSLYAAWETSPVYLATDGMLYIAHGDHDSGRDRYRKALIVADNEKRPSLVQRIKIHWLHEEALAGTVTKIQSEHLVSKIETNHKISDDNNEVDEFWKKMKEEIISICLASDDLYIGKRNDCHFLEQYI